MRVINHHQRTVLIRQVADLLQRRQVAIHGEHPIGDDDGPTCTGAVVQLRGGLQLLLQVSHVPVGVAEAGCLGQADAVNNRGVVQRIGNDGVLGPKQGFEHSPVGVEAAGEQDGVIGAQKGRQPLLQLQVDILRAANEAHRGHSETSLVQGPLGGCDDPFIIGQPQVVVRAEVQHLARLIPQGPGLDARRLRRINMAFSLVESRLAQLPQFGCQLLFHVRVHCLAPRKRSSQVLLFRPVRPWPRRTRPAIGRREGNR